MKMYKLESLQRKQSLYNMSLIIAEVIITFLVIVIPTVAYLSSTESGRKLFKKATGAISGLRLKKMKKGASNKKFSFFSKFFGKK